MLHHTPDRNTTDRFMFGFKENQSFLLAYCLQNNLFFLLSNLSHFDYPVHHHAGNGACNINALINKEGKVETKRLIKPLLKKNLSLNNTHLKAI